MTHLKHFSSSINLFFILIGIIICHHSVAFHSHSSFFRPAQKVHYHHKNDIPDLDIGKSSRENNDRYIFESSSMSSKNDVGNDRRVFLSKMATSISMLSIASSMNPEDALADSSSVYYLPEEVQFPWKIDPINKRSGITVFDAEKAGYNVGFVTYLSRFLLNFDRGCQLWWFQCDSIKRGSTPESIEQIRFDQFAQFAASVEVGLQGYEGSDDPKRLLKDLYNKYGTIPSRTSSENDAEFSSKRRIAKAARRHIALLFGLLEKQQPTDALADILAQIDDAKITQVELIDSATTKFAGYDSLAPPLIEIDDGNAKAQAILQPTGRLLRIDIVDAGNTTYAKPPLIDVGRSCGPECVTIDAKGIANLDSKGKIESVKITDAGKDFFNTENIVFNVVQRPNPDLSALATDRYPVFRAILDNAIKSIEITEQGSGYEKNNPVKVYVSSRTQSSRSNERESDKQLVGMAYPTVISNSFSSFLSKRDTAKLDELQQKFLQEYPQLRPQTEGGTVSGFDSDTPTLPFWTGKKSQSAEFLRLLPAGVGLEYDNKIKRYVLAVDTEFKNKYPGYLQDNTNRWPLGVDFGPRARTPIERNRKLGLSEYWRFGLSGAICLSSVCLTLTPFDVVKTKQQTNPAKYTELFPSIQEVYKNEGIPTFYTGWLPTLVGNFLSGGVQYASTEYLRRMFSEMAGLDAAQYEVLIILAASGIASAIAGCVFCPFEAVRIRTVAQPKFAANAGGVLQRILDEEGIESLVNTIPIFLFKNIPYAMTKFTVFDISTDRLYQAFPAAQEQLQLSLLVSLAGGIMGGTAAAIISNPADSIISELKKAKTELSPLDAIQNMIARGGVGPFFAGLPLRIVRYTLIASLSFVTYDAIRFALGIGSDDLKLYLDVLGGALQK